MAHRIEKFVEKTWLSNFQKESFVCRLCGEFGSSRWSFYTKPEMITSIKYVFDLEIDEEKEKKFGISNRVCDGCFAIMTAAEALKRKAVKLQVIKWFSNYTKS